MLRSLYRLEFRWEAIEGFAFIMDSLSDGGSNAAIGKRLGYTLTPIEDFSELPQGFSGRTSP